MSLILVRGVDCVYSSVKEGSLQPGTTRLSLPHREHEAVGNHGIDESTTPGKQCKILLGCKLVSRGC